MLIFGCCISPRDLEQSNPEAIMKGSRPVIITFEAI